MIVNILLVLGGISFIWIAIGTPLGLIWGLVHLLEAKYKKAKFNRKLWFWTTFGGMVVLLAVLLIYALAKFVYALNGDPGWPLIIDYL